MRKLSLLIAGTSVAVLAGASQMPAFDFNVSRNSVIANKTIGLSGASNGELSFSKESLSQMSKKKKATKLRRLESSDPDGLYNITTLLSEDFSIFQGDDNDPTAINVTNEDGTIKGLPSWWGADVYAADRCAYVDCHKVYEEDDPYVFQVEGQINTAVIPIEDAESVQIKFRAKSAPYDDSEHWEALNVIVMCVSDEMPGVARMVDFDWDGVAPNWNDEYWFNFEIPETFVYHGEEEDITLPLTGIYVRFYTTGIPFYLGDLRVETRSAKVVMPQNLGFKNFTEEGYVATWDAVEVADKYVVNVFNANFDEENYSFVLTEAQTLETSANEIEVNIDTAGLTYFMVTAYEGAQPSPTTEPFPVFGVLPPVMNPISNPGEDSFNVSWQPANGATLTEVWAYRQLKTVEALSDYPFVTLDFSGVDYEYSGGAMNLDKFAYGWMASPSAEIDGGVIILDNYGALWGNPYAQLISVGAYDFSDIEGKVKVKVMARSEEGCGIVVATGGYDEEADTILTMDADAVEELSADLTEYTFELEAKNSRTMFIIQVIGFDVVEIQSVTVEASFPQGAEIGWPYKDIYTQESSAVLAYPEDAEYDRVKVTGRSIKSITAEIFGSDYTIMEATSNFSDPVYVDSPSLVGVINPETEVPVYYNIDGTVVGNTYPVNNGIYIEKRGAKAKKITVSK